MNTDESDLVTKAIRTQQIVVVALASGVLTFIAVVLVMWSVAPPNAAGPMQNFITYGGIAALVAVILLHPLILGLIDSANRKSLTVESPMKLWLGTFAMRSTFGSALIEGAAFMCIIGAMLDRQPWGLIAGGLGAAAMLAFHFPTVPKFEAYVERQRNSLVT